MPDPLPPRDAVRWSAHFLAFQCCLDGRVSLELSLPPSTAARFRLLEACSASSSSSELLALPPSTAMKFHFLEACSAPPLSLAPLASPPTVLVLSSGTPTDAETLTGVLLAEGTSSGEASSMDELAGLPHSRICSFKVMRLRPNETFVERLGVKWHRQIPHTTQVW